VFHHWDPTAITEFCNAAKSSTTHKTAIHHLERSFNFISYKSLTQLLAPYLNKSLVTLEESPVAKKRLHAPSYCNKKLRKIRCLKEKV
jgi:hypothetical protein